jgi:16S rRNA (guanine966-N2)-methyltransferase
LGNTLIGRTSNRSLRIIGGKYRSRKVTFADVASIRPTPNRVRETLFSWLSPHLSGARCIEPFAGSGILSMEALSRGAANVSIIDQSRQVIEHIRTQMTKFVPDERDYTLYHGDALAWMSTANPETLFDIVFLDPPFADALLSNTCKLLQERHLLAEGALIYIESETAIQDDSLPTRWEFYRQKKAGSVHYCLCRTT